MLDLQTGHVSPQFHVAHDPTFLTVKGDTTKYQWSIKAGLSTAAVSTPQSSKRSKSQPNRRSKRTKIAATTTTKSNTNLSKDTATNDESATVPTTRNTTSSVHLDSNQQHQQQTVAKRSTRTRKTTQRLIEAMKSVISITSEGVPSPPPTQNPEGDIIHEIFAFSSLFPDAIDLESDIAILAMKVASDPDTMYFYEAMKMPDREKFIDAMQQEIEGNYANDQFELIHRSQIPKHCTILPSVWQLRRKRHLATGKIKKYKARINVGGSRMIKNKHYDQTYSPVASWAIIRLLMTIAAVHRWPTKQLDYVFAFPQAPIERELYMSIPKGYQVPDGSNQDYALKLKKNIYGKNKLAVFGMSF